MNRFGPFEIMNNRLEDSAMQPTTFTIGRLSNHGKRARSPPCSLIKTTGFRVDKSMDKVIG